MSELAGNNPDGGNSGGRAQPAREFWSLVMAKMADSGMPYPKNYTCSAQIAWYEKSRPVFADTVDEVMALLQALPEDALKQERIREANEAIRVARLISGCLP